jgi:hypothetical protein
MPFFGFLQLMYEYDSDNNEWGCDVDCGGGHVSGDIMVTAKVMVVMWCCGDNKWW